MEGFGLVKIVDGHARLHFGVEKDFRLYQGRGSHWGLHPSAGNILE